MTTGIQTIIYPVSDLKGASRLFATLCGVEPVVESPYYVGFQVNGQDIGLDPDGHANGGGPLPYWHVEDVHATVRDLVAAGASLLQDVRDVGGGTLVATLKDHDGNVIGLRQVPR